MIWFWCLLPVSSSAPAAGFDKLVSVIVLFRHGARAPTDRLSNRTYEKFFPNGLGELTSVGIENSYRLGKFLGERYVASGFLRSPLLPSQVHFRSVANNRCLMTASLVGSGMFEVDGISTTGIVPIYSQENGDMVLTAPINCSADIKRIFDTCGRAPKSSYKKFTEFQGFIYECLGLHKLSGLFRSGTSFEIADSLINEYENGLQMPKWFESYKSEIYQSFVKVENFMLGAAEFHNSAILRLKSGFLLHTVLQHLDSSWQQFILEGSLKRKKFVAYSTQDWLMQAFMDSLGIRAQAVGDSSLPKYNSLIILELRSVKGMPFVKAFYRDPINEVLMDVSSAIRGCSTRTGCPLPLVLSCCDSYITSNPEKECYPELSTYDTHPPSCVKYSS
ncbi:hypothetical protein KIN20_024770 [Parelaphostrongylus tenuis]|nr:hypothetical protein KIN20_024770 [Parelaphostrongylus tenuis]